MLAFRDDTPRKLQFGDLVQFRPVFLSYLLSFIYLMIYWNNHHHLLKAMHSANGGAKVPAALYLIAIISAFFVPLTSYLLYIAVALMWIVPDRRIAREI